VIEMMAAAGDFETGGGVADYLRPPVSYEFN
jgi:hypothetical protein